MATTSDPRPVRAARGSEISCKGWQQNTPTISAQADIVRLLLDELEISAPIMIAPDVGVPIALSLAAVSQLLPEGASARSWLARR